MLDAVAVKEKADIVMAIKTAAKNLLDVSRISWINTGVPRQHALCRISLASKTTGNAVRAKEKRAFRITTAG